jgi:hypothetical protein
MTDAELAAEDVRLGEQWVALREALEECGGASGSPGEWLYERLDEIETEMKRRGMGEFDDGRFAALAARGAGGERE